MRAWTDIADEIRNRPHLAEADMWFARRLLRRVVSSWDQQRLLIRTKFAESSRTKGYFHFAIRLQHCRRWIFSHVFFSQKCSARRLCNPDLKPHLKKK
jgi:hypothetical protein